MAITPAVRLEYTSGSTLASYTTGSSTPTANALLTVHVATTSIDNGVTPAPIPSSLTGNGVTWVLVASQVSTSTNIASSLWRAMGSAPTTGTLVVTLPAQSGNIAVKMTEWTGVLTTGTNGSGAVRQSITGTVATTTPSVTLGSGIVSGNATAGFMNYSANIANQSSTAGAGYTKIGTDLAPAGTPTIQTATEWRAAGTTTVNLTTTNSGPKTLIGIEIVVGATNAAPVANAGPDQNNIEPYSTVTLNFSGSTDSDGTISTYTVSQTAGTTVTLSGSGNSRTFTAPVSLAGGTLTFSLIVTDNLGSTSSADTVNIVVLPWDSWVRVSGAWIPRKTMQHRVTGAWVS